MRRREARKPATNWHAAIIAGIAAGVIAFVLEAALWWVFSKDLSEMLFRDARLAAAIFLGRSVLPPPATFDSVVMVAATLIHFILSIAYGVIIAPLIARLNIIPSLMAGAAFGVILYIVNMHGFTAVFPWFVATRDPITAATH